jgi:anti-anti-sigma factor
MTAPFQYISVANNQGVPVITITVDQIRDATRATELRDEILNVVQTSQANNLIFDLSRLNFIGSIGFMAFLSVRRQLAAGRIILCDLSQNVSDAFAICQLISKDPAKTSPFEYANNVPEAVASLAK